MTNPSANNFEHEPLAPLASSETLPASPEVLASQAVESASAALDTITEGLSLDDANRVVGELVDDVRHQYNEKTLPLEETENPMLVGLLQVDQAAVGPSQTVDAVNQAPIELLDRPLHTLELFAGPAVVEDIVSKLEAHHSESVAPESRNVSHQDEVYDQEKDGPEFEKEAAEQHVRGVIMEVDRIIDQHIAGEAIDESAKKIYEARAGIRHGGYSLETASQLADAFIRMDSAFKTTHPDTFIGVSYCNEIPADMLAKLYAQNPGESGGGQSIKEYIETLAIDSTDPYKRKATLRLVNKIYKESGGILSEQAMQDPIVEKLISNVSSRAKLEVELMPFPIGEKDPSIISENNQEIALHSMLALEHLGLPQTMNAEYLASALTRRSGENGYDVRAVQLELEAAIKAVEAIGIDKAKQLYEQIGLECLPYYSISELKTLVGVMDRDPDVIAHLQAGDVTCEFSDFRGDHNGAMVGSVLRETYQTASGRTLRFEMTSPASIYRHMAFLKSRGIAPSTLVYSAHGDPGAAGIGSGPDRSVFVSKLSAEVEKNMDARHADVIRVDQTQIGRLVQEYMQPNRGIDSSDEAVGKRVVIFSTCSGDKVAPERGVMTSVAQEIAIASGKGVDVYAADEVMYEHHRQDGDVTFNDYFSSKPENGERTISVTKKLTIERGLLGIGKKLKREPVMRIPFKKQSARQGA